MKTTQSQPGRQGDVLLVPTKKRATGPIRVDADGSRTLAHGEVTGHRHRFTSREEGVTLRQESEIRSDWLILEIGPGGGDLVHEEHSTVRVPEGRYEVRIQCEYDPTVHGARRVED